MTTAYIGIYILHGTIHHGTIPRGALGDFRSIGTADGGRTIIAIILIILIIITTIIIILIGEVIMAVTRLSVGLRSATTDVHTWQICAQERSQAVIEGTARQEEATPPR